MTADEIVEELKVLGKESIKKVLMNHGAPEPIFGVKVEDLKKIQKRVKTNHELALALYDTGISDAMYLAGLIADDPKMTKKDLQSWVEKASWYMISEYTVPWVAAGSKHGWDIGLKWIESKKEKIAAAGWATLGCLVGVKPDDQLDLVALEQLLEQVGQTIHDQPNRVRFAMNGFVIAIGSFVMPLSATAKKVAKAMGKVDVDVGRTACKVPDALETIAKVEKRGSLGKKRKTFKC